MINCPRCQRPYDSNFPEGIRLQLGWLIVYPCFACTQDFLTFYPKVSTKKSGPQVELVPAKKPRTVRKRTAKKRTASEATKKKMREAWARRKLAKAAVEDVQRQLKADVRQLKAEMYDN